ncbi:MAG: hypothetical protein HZB15_00620 [Actinobacteria bacterium]|nr:hypothetical protein [Actinomycetota bacterium]
MPAVALLSGCLIVGLQPPGLLRRGLSWPPLVAMGRISYGLYLFHWPVYVVLRERGWDLTSPLRFVVAMAITVAVATVSYHVVEMPVRRATWRPSATVPAAALACGVALIVALAVEPSQPVIQADDQLLAAAAIEPATSVEALVPAPTTAATVAPPETVAAGVVDTTRAPADPTPRTAVGAQATTSTMALTVTYELAPPRPVRMLVVGDSTALYVGEGLAAWTLEHPEAAQVSVIWYQGCTFLLEPEMVTFDLPRLVDDSRDTVRRRMPAAISELQPDVVVLMVTMSDVANRQWSADEGPLSPFDPRYVERLAGAYRELTDGILGSGVGEVVWVVPPTPVHLWLEPDMNEADRYAVQHQVIRDVASGYDDRVSVVDLDAWLTAAGHDDDPWWRTDGVHLTDASGAALAEQYLGPLLVRRATEG